MRHLSLSVCLAVALIMASVQPAATGQPAGSQDRMAPGPPHESNIVVGEIPPASFVLDSIDGESFDLASTQRPLLLLFFRGTW